MAEHMNDPSEEGNEMCEYDDKRQDIRGRCLREIRANDKFFTAAIQPMAVGFESINHVRNAREQYERPPTDRRGYRGIRWDRNNQCYIPDDQIDVGSLLFTLRANLGEVLNKAGFSDDQRVHVVNCMQMDDPDRKSGGRRNHLGSFPKIMSSVAK